MKDPQRLSSYGGVEPEANAGRKIWPLYDRVNI